MIRLVPNTGIQYADLPEIPREKLVRHDFQMRVGERFSQVMPAASAGYRGDDDGDDYAARSTGLRSRSGDLRVIDRLLSSNPRGIWIPLPFEGGALWVAVRMRKDNLVTGSSVIRATLAIDTTLDSDGNLEGLSVDELGERAPSPTSRRFWRSRAVESWLRMLAVKAAEDSRNAADVARTVQELQVAIAGLADFLAKDPKRPARILMERRPTVSEGVIVDMVLDLGNSRTCALLEERMEGGRRQRLELRYPDAPEVRDQSPFSTQSAFFEHEIVPQSIEGTSSFRFLSVLKLGSGAREALRLNRLDPRPLGISTPKRYLWEHYGRVEWRWRSANRVDDRGIPPMVRGPLIDRMDPGAVFGSAPALPELAEPNHPRAACMVWALVDLLEQAYQQVNSPEWRRTAQNAPMCDRRRTIQNLVVTFPAGLHSMELENFRKAAMRACRLWANFRSSPEGFCSDLAGAPDDPEFAVPVPRVQMVCDEGMAIQLCWLYGEAVHRFGCDARLLIDALGRSRPRHDRDGAPTDDGEAPGSVPTLRLASIDIGGGTIDLAIADFTVREGLPAAVAFDCRRLFHDSISRAGDDVVRGILEDHAFPSLIRQVGCDIHSWNRLFGIASASSDADQELRRELVRDAWIPLAMRCLEELEKSAAESVTVRLGDACSATALLARLRSALLGDSAPTGRKGEPGPKRLEDVEISISRKDMRRIVRNSIGRTLEQCADIVDQFGCDLLVVGGRPSSNREIRDQIYAAMAVPPGQVVFLAELSVEDWYPFADRTGRIHDAKTCGVVGGSVAFLAQYAHGAFTVRFDHVEEPAPIIGFLRQAGASQYPSFPDEHALRFGDGETRVPFMPMQPLVLACRRVDDPGAEARPIYQVRLKRRIRDDLLRSPGIQKEVSVKFDLVKPSREEESAPDAAGGLPRIADRVQLREGAQRGSVQLRSPGGALQEIAAEEAIEIRLCTLIDLEGYWIDTGTFKPLELEMDQ